MLDVKVIPSNLSWVTCVTQSTGHFAANVLENCREEREPEPGIDPSTTSLRAGALTNCATGCFAAAFPGRESMCMARPPSPNSFVLFLLILAFVQAQKSSIACQPFRISSWEETKIVKSSTKARTLTFSPWSSIPTIVFDKRTRSGSI